MSKMKKIALVGRPNVGKSSLFNRLCKKRIAIVDEKSGVTRDRLYAPVEFFGQTVEVIDTAGIDQKDKSSMQKEVVLQTEIAIEEADSIIMVVDYSVGITDLDELVARKLKTTNKPVTLAVNKVDDERKKDDIYAFYPLGFKEMVAVSATQSYQLAELLESATKDIPNSCDDSVSSDIKVCIVGRANVGKSTLLNYLVGERRSCVGEKAGTTRDSIFSRVLLDGIDLTLSDTAGIRRKNKQNDVIEKFADIRTKAAIEQADICLFVFDSVDGLTHQEKRIIQSVEEMGKGLILVCNKWDLMKDTRMEHCFFDLQQSSPFLKYCPLLFISAKTGRNVEQIVPAIKDVYKDLKKRVPTGELNRFIESAMQRVHPPMIKGKRLRVYYLTQVSSNPVKFTLFINHKDLFSDSYLRYLINNFREEFVFSGCPLRFILRDKAKTNNRRRFTKA